MSIDLATEARRWLIALVAGTCVCLCLIAFVEVPLGITSGWRLVLNQLPAMYTVHRVIGWTAA